MTAVLKPPSHSVGVSFQMTLNDGMRVIDQAAAVGVRTVQFIGGEPTLHPNLADLVLHASNKDLAVEVFTNSDDPDQHHHITGRPAHARTKANIVKALARGIPLRTGRTVVRAVR